MRINVTALLPASRLKNFLLRRQGHAVAPSARISPVVVLGRTRLTVEPDASIGPLNVFRNMARLEVGRGAEIGQLNWVSAAPFLVAESGSPVAGRLVLEPHSSVTNRHYVDVSGGVVVRRFAILAGVRSVLMTHGIDVKDAVLDTDPITIGEYAMVGGNVSMVMGSTVPPRSVVGMGSVVVSGLTEPDTLYVGAPARARRSIDIGEFGTRRSGAVPPRRGQAGRASAASSGRSHGGSASGES